MGIREIALGVLFYLLALYSAIGQVAAPVWHDADQRTASGTGTTLTVARPGNVAPGDLVILMVTQQRSPKSTASGFTAPAGFTPIRSEHDNNQTDVPEVAAFYKIATASEPASYTSTVTNSGSTPNWKAVAARVTGHEPGDPIGSHSGVNSGTNSVSTVTVPELATGVKNSLLVATRTVRRAVSSESTPAGMDLEWTMNGSGTSDDKNNPPAFRGVSEVRPNAGSTGSRQFSWSGAARAAGLMFTINRLTPLADLALEMSVSNSVPDPGEPVIFTLTVINNGPNNATGVVVNQQLPPGYTYQSSLGLGAYDPATGIWSVGNLANGLSAVMEIVATVNPTGDYNIVATVEGLEDDPLLSNNQVRAGIYPSDIALGMSIDNGAAEPGSIVEFTITVRNNGPESARNVRVTDQLPNGYDFISAVASTGSWSNPIWTIPTMANGASATLRIRATVKANGSHVNVATARSDSFDPDLGNNEDNAMIANPNLPRVNGLFYGDGDYERYVLIATSARGSRLYGFFDSENARYYSALVVDRSVNDNVVGNSAYTNSAGWSSPHPFNRLLDSEYMGFTLTCGSHSWTWQQGYGSQPDNPRNNTNPTWFSSHLAGAGSGTPPPGYVSSSSMVANLNNYARGNAPSWDVTLGGTLSYNDWKSPFVSTSPDDVTKVAGFPVNGDITYSQAHGWEWAMVYEFSVDLSSAGPHPVRLSNIGSHHSPAKTGGEDDPILLGGPLLDWGDLPAPYPTTQAANGPRHELVAQGAFLGDLRPDLEPDGQPHPGARGDDNSGIPDEDGIIFRTPVVAGKPAVLQVTAGTAGNLSGWIDFNGNGTLTQINVLSSTGPSPVAPGLLGDTRLGQAGVYLFTIEVPSDANGQMFSRWRFTNQAGQGGNSITDYASTGEVEDYALAIIGDMVWMDVNGNGLQDANEPGINGVVVQLLHADGTPVLDGTSAPMTTTTSQGGLYHFSGLPAGVPFVLQFSQPSGLVFTRLDADRTGLNGPLNSDVNPLTGRTDSFMLVGGENNLNLDAGLTEPAALGNYVWEDMNGNGIQDDPATGIGGVTVRLHWEGYGPDAIPGTEDDNQPITTTVTSSQGYYEFSNLIPGDYKVVFEAPEGFVHTARGRGADPEKDSDADPATGETGIVSLSGGENNTSIDAGFLRYSTLGDRVWLDVNANGIQDPGEMGLEGFAVSLEGTDGLDQAVARTTTTDADGLYSFADLLPGTYVVAFDIPSSYVVSPQGAGDAPELDSDADPVTGRTAAVTLISGETNLSIDAGFYQYGSISGKVTADTNGDGIGDRSLEGVVLTLLDASGNVVLDSSNQPVTTTTAADGTYLFENIVPGSYQVSETQPKGYGSISDKDGGNPDLIGDIELVVVENNGENTGNDFLEFLRCSPGEWTEWKEEWEDVLGGKTAPEDNPDGDRYSNLIEYAFCLPPHSGARKPFCLVSSQSVAGAVDGVFRRTVGGPQDITFILEHSPELQNPTVWSSLVLDDGNTTVTNNGNGSETVRIINLEAITGHTGGSGFVRIRVQLDNGTDTAEDTTEVLGWTRTQLGLCCRTYNNPFLACASFTGTVDVVDGQDLVLTTSAGPVDLSKLMLPGVAYYIEVETGALEGHRFDVIGAAGDCLTVANDPNLYSWFPPFNSVAGTAPAALAGGRIALHQHRTLGGMFPVGSFGPGNSQNTADEVQILAGGVWTIYWLYSNNGGPQWVDAADATLANQNHRVIAPGQGMFFHNRTSPTAIVAFGEVRGHSFHRPLANGVNLIGGGYPLDQSATGTGSRQLNRADGFFGSRDFKTADSFFLWRKDETPSATGYDSFFLLDGAPTHPTMLRWVMVGDAQIAPRDSELRFKRDGGVMLRVSQEHPAYKIPLPWSP